VTQSSPSTTSPSLPAAMSRTSFLSTRV